MRARRAIATGCAILLALAVYGCSSPNEDTANDQTPGSDREEPAVVFDVTTDSFEAGGQIPAKYTRTASPLSENVSPEVSWSEPPAGTESFALVMIDRHPIAQEWVHWMVVDIPAAATQLGEGASGALAAPARELHNAWGEAGYGGPEPPPGSGEHVYEITVYALDVPAVDLEETASLTDFLTAIRDHILAANGVSGIYAR